ncbi:hypothetical protein LOK49_LG05G00531 [Camellia lanceoleosa]|uniref:Uncharacterized protein n=1 Tax=Camellia lanceoleosa TaxID=1840588 RepID=A0ACC0HNI8_9ERIC|nr:hypothetical protein LOK49_LG05G00531 [Camellia lanceoleosa]
MSYVDFKPPPSPPPPPPPFVSLKKLTLFRSQLTDEALEAVMSTCLLLESLALHYCYGLVNVKVSGTALKEFVFYRGNHLLGANLFDVGNWDLENWDLQKSNVRILLDQLAQVEVLAANDWFLQFRLSCWTGIHKKLPTMDIKPLCPRGTCEFIEINPQAGEQLPQVSLLLQLKSIEFLYFSGYKYEMELVKLLLEKTVSLEIMSVVFEDPEQYVGVFMFQWRVPINQREFLREQVCLLTRASPRAQILFI